MDFAAASGGGVLSGTGGCVCHQEPHGLVFFAFRMSSEYHERTQDFTSPLNLADLPFLLHLCDIATLDLAHSFFFNLFDGKSGSKFQFSINACRDGQWLSCQLVFFVLGS